VQFDSLMRVCSCWPKRKLRNTSVRTSTVPVLMQMVMKWWSYVLISVLWWQSSDLSEWRGAESVGHRLGSSNFVTVVLYFGKWSKVESRFRIPQPLQFTISEIDCNWSFSKHRVFLFIQNNSFIYESSHAVGRVVVEANNWVVVWMEHKHARSTACLRTNTEYPVRSEHSNSTENY